MNFLLFPCPPASLPSSSCPPACALPGALPLPRSTRGQGDAGLTPKGGCLPAETLPLLPPRGWCPTGGRDGVPPYRQYPQLLSSLWASLSTGGFGAGRRASLSRGGHLLRYEVSGCGERGGADTACASGQALRGVFSRGWPA